MSRIARRTSRVDASGIRKVFDLAAKLKDPCNLSIGQPDFDVPEPVKAAALDAVRRGFNKYTPTQGIPELRERIRRHMAESRRWNPEEVFVTAGVSGGLTLAVLALVDEGDEVLIPDPYFLSYKQLVKLVDAKPVYVDTYPDSASPCEAASQSQGFRLTPERLERAVTKKTRLLFLNTPVNPTGAVSTEADLKGIAEICRKNNILVLSDEVYDAFCYDAPFVSITKFLPEAMVLGGFSKTYGMTGWRLGYACGPKDVLQQMLKMQQFSFVCAPSMVQAAGVAALDVDVSKQIAEFKRKRDLIYDGLKGKFEVVKPAGAFYIFPRVPRGTDMEFVEKAIAKSCLVIPGSVFSERNTHFRISYATTVEQIERGIKILNSLA